MDAARFSILMGNSPFVVIAKDKNVVAETEDQLISAARDAVSQCNWVVGECAQKWTKKYARGRTDGDFGAMVGLSGDQIYQRRRVWEVFGESHADYEKLKWSFFYVALNWDDAGECLNWANENEATVAELRAWRRARNGEDLTADPEPEPYSEWAAPLIDTSQMPLSTVMDPSAFVPFGEGERAGLGGQGSEVSTMNAAARDAEYSPFRPGAASPAPGEQAAEVALLERSDPTPEQIWKRTVSMLERLNRSLSRSVLTSYDDLPEKQQDRLRTAYNELQEKLGDLIS